ncbi:MAG TPA: hypothetical protein PK625_10535 [Spirochaetales bacterium]|nr:hypothetical protein [Spirochaetales bacterium]
MRDDALDFLGSVTFITGPEKNCGKTTFMNRAAELARRASRERGLRAPAILTVGYDGETRDFLSGARKPSVTVDARDVFVTAERFLRSGGAAPEILDLVPGSTALGRLAVARATRRGTVALIGPEGNAAVDWTIARVVDGGLADTVFVDGAINRVTQVAGRPGAKLVYVMRVDRATLSRSGAQARRLAALVGLPVAEPGAPGVLEFEGALTADEAGRLPRQTDAVSVADFTKVFLDASELAAFTRTRALYVRRPVDFAGFSVSLRGVAQAEFLAELGLAAGMASFSPYETGRVAA